MQKKTADPRSMAIEFIKDLVDLDVWMIPNINSI